MSVLGAPQKKRILRALVRALRPLAAMMIRSGIRHREFSDACRHAFVDAAIKHQRDHGFPDSSSKVAALTGVPRQQVAKLRKIRQYDASSELASVEATAVLLQEWRSNPEFLDSDGQPRELERRGTGPTFERLCAIVSREMSSDTALRDLVTSGAAKVTRTNKVAYLDSAFVPRTILERIERAIEHPLRAQLTCLDHNLINHQKDRWIERFAFSHSIDLDDLPKLRRITRDQGRSFTQAINEHIEALEVDDADSPDMPLATVGFGVFYFEEENLNELGNP